MNTLVKIAIVLFVYLSNVQCILDTFDAFKVYVSIIISSLEFVLTLRSEALAIFITIDNSTPPLGRSMPS